jgi:hypothetical protein
VLAHAHVPLAQIAPVPQAWPHAPQFALSECRSTHAVPHAVRPDGHPQAPAVHSVVGAVQVAPHAPQLAGSVASVAHREPQSICPDGHMIGMSTGTSA